jgi:hypothetical protein
MEYQKTTRSFIAFVANLCLIYGSVEQIQRSDRSYSEPDHL